MMRFSPNQLLRSVVPSLGGLRITTPICHCGCSLGLKAEHWGGEDVSRIALCCYYSHPRPVVYKAWSPDQQQHLLRTFRNTNSMTTAPHTFCLQLRFTESETLGVGPGNQKPSRCLECTFMLAASAKDRLSVFKI